jgi:hypothetical protein
MHKAKNKEPIDGEQQQHTGKLQADNTPANT